MVHPYARDVIPVGNELSGVLADDGCIAAVYSHTRIIIQQQAAHILRFHDQQGQAILP
ncbi:hypothetical protein D3C80_1375660 [compost metagenome]